MKQRLAQIFTDRFSASFPPGFRPIFQNALLVLSFCLIVNPVSAQRDLPGKIRGYKVYQAAISVRSAAEKPDAEKSVAEKSVAEKPAAESKSETFVKVTEPQLTDVSLSGITFEISAEIDSLPQSGTVDFMTFNDFRVNGLAVEVEEYKNSFEFRKNQPLILPKPARIFLGIRETIGAFRELRNSKDEWLVTGRVFVFGRFKKYGFSFKRVVPVEINLKIKNPLRENLSSK